MHQAPGIKIIPGRIVFLLSLFVAAYWIISLSINVYSYAVVGAIFELSWLPALLLSALIPIAAILFWAKEKFSLRSFYLYALLVVLITLLVGVFVI